MGGERAELLLQRYLHEHIPISAAMEVTVAFASVDLVRLQVPLLPNINHRSTVFGGSAAAVAILAGWSLLHLRLGDAAEGARIVIQRSSIDYLEPIEGDFEVVAAPPAAQAWDRFLRTYQRRGRGRIELFSSLLRTDRLVAKSAGTYVLLPCGVVPAPAGEQLELVPGAARSHYDPSGPTTRRSKPIQDTRRS